VSSIEIINEYSKNKLKAIIYITTRGCLRFTAYKSPSHYLRQIGMSIHVSDFYSSRLHLGSIALTSLLHPISSCVNYKRNSSRYRPYWRCRM